MAGTEDDKVQRRLDSYKGQYTGVADLFHDVYRIDGTPFITVTFFLHFFCIEQNAFLFSASDLYRIDGTPFYHGYLFFFNFKRIFFLNLFLRLFSVFCNSTRGWRTAFSEAPGSSTFIFLIVSSSIFFFLQIY